MWSREQTEVREKGWEKVVVMLRVRKLKIYTVLCVCVYVSARISTSQVTRKEHDFLMTSPTVTNSTWQPWNLTFSQTSYSSQVQCSCFSPSTATTQLPYRKITHDSLSPLISKVRSCRPFVCPVSQSLPFASAAAPTVHVSRKLCPGPSIKAKPRPPEESDGRRTLAQAGTFRLTSPP